MQEKDRVLGDEWKSWDGKIEESKATPGLFLSLSFLTIILFSLSLSLIEYLIYPRLASISPALPNIMNMIVISIISLSFIWMVLLSLTVILNKNLIIGRFGILMPYTFKLGDMLRVNKDKLGNSFIQLNNRIVGIKRYNYSPDEILVLLPRCLSIGVQNKLKIINEKYNIKYFTLAGGEAARQKIIEHKPKAIIAVACERDLVAGMKDVQGILVFGIPNKRPNGPCKDTIISMGEYETAIMLFLGLDRVKDDN